MRKKAVPVGLEDFERKHFTEGFKWRYLEEMFWKSKKMYKIFNKYEFVREKLNIVEKIQFDKIWEMKDSEQSFKTSLLDLSNYLIYYFENIANYADLMSFVEQELHNYIEYMEKFKNFRINVDLENIFKRDKLRNFLLKYNEKANKYNLEFINYYTKYINYWDINIKKKFFSCLLGKDRLKEFMLNKKRIFRINGVDYFQIEEKEKYSEIYRIEIENDIKIEYYSKDLEYESFGNVGFLYKEKNFDIENKSLKGKELNFERYRDNRDEMNVERISKEDFLKELEIIVNTYEDIYNDNEVQKMFENFKENF